MGTYDIVLSPAFYLCMRTWSMGNYDIVLSPVFYLCMRTWSIGIYSPSLCASVNIITLLDQGSIFSIQKTKLLYNHMYI